MDPTNFQTAATYINNLLLARGLLRNGKAIDFAQLAAPPVHGTDKKSHAATNVTVTAEIINLVHDLILRRDRDQEYQESLAFTLRSLRADSTRATTENERLREKNQDLQRQVASAQAAARSAQTAAHNAESTARTLREEVSRVKTALGQVRTQCANDVRKRDVQIQKLKTHLAARQRGNKTGLVGSSISITPGSTGRAPAGIAGGSGREEAPSLEDAEYSLKQESTEFLTQLSQSLSDENDSLISLIRGTVNTLRELQGLPHNQPPRQRQSCAGETSTFHQNDQGEANDFVQVAPTSYETLSADLEGLLNGLSDLLTNPLFAPIEEVHVREEEIQRLREGWEKMEGRWHEAIVMMQGWRKRMLSGGDTVNVEELRVGLCLGEGLAPSPRSRASIKPALSERERSLIQGMEEGDEQNAGTGSPNVDDLLEEDDSVDELDTPVLHDLRSSEMFDVNVSSDKHHDGQLAERHANIEPQSKRCKRQVSFEAAAKENLDNSPDEPGDNGQIAQKDSTQPNQRPHPAKSARRQSPLSKSANPHLKARPKSAIPRKPSTHRSSPGVQPPLSVEQKLKLAEREARRASSISTTASPEAASQSSLPPDLRNGGGKRGKKRGEAEGHGTLEAGRDESERRTVVSSPVKRTKIRGRARKRKSTLSPEELEGLMMGPGDGVG